MSLRADLVEHIRRVDGDNTLRADILGNRIVCEFYGDFPDGRRVEVTGYVNTINGDKRMGAAALADAIVDHFNLETEN